MDLFSSSRRLIQCASDNTISWMTPDSNLKTYLYFRDIKVWYTLKLMKYGKFILNRCHRKGPLRNCDCGLGLVIVRIQLDTILMSKVIVSLPYKKNMEGSGSPASSKAFGTRWGRYVNNLRGKKKKVSESSDIATGTWAKGNPLLKFWSPHYIL